MIQFAINYLDFPDNYSDKLFPINVKRTVHKEEHKKCPLKPPFQSGSFVVIVGTLKRKLAQQRVDELKKNYPELSTLKVNGSALKVNIYQVKGGNWRVYIGSFSKSSANTFKYWAIEQGIIGDDAFVTFR